MIKFPTLIMKNSMGKKVTHICSAVTFASKSSLLSFPNRWISRCSFANARTTRTPDKLSLTVAVRRPCKCHVRPNIDHAIPKKSGEKQNNRRRNKHQQREPPVHPEQHDSYAHKQKNVRKENLDTLNQHPFERFG